MYVMFSFYALAHHRSVFLGSHLLCMSILCLIKHPWHVLCVSDLNQNHLNFYRDLFIYINQTLLYVF